jgi:hypothetical protein
VNVPTIDLTQLNNHGNPWPFNDPATEKDDCNVAKTAEAVYLFNGHQLTAKQVRSIGHDLSGPTGNVLARKVFLSEGLVDGTDFVTANPKPTATLRQLLHDGWYVGGYVDHGVLNATTLPTGDPHYTGVHCIGLWGWRAAKDANGKFVRLIWDHDSLFDGRRPAIPFGRQHVSFGLVLPALASAAEKLTNQPGAGLWTGWAVRVPL